MVNVGDQVWIVEYVGEQLENYVIANVEVIEALPNSGRISWGSVYSASNLEWVHPKTRQRKTSRFYTSLLEAKTYVMKQLQQEKADLLNRLNKIDEMTAQLVFLED